MKNYFQVLHLDRKQLEKLPAKQKSRLINRKFVEQKRRLQKRHLSLVSKKENLAVLQEAKDNLLGTSSNDKLFSGQDLWLDERPILDREIIEITGKNLTVDQIAQIAKFNCPAKFTDDKEIIAKLNESCQYIMDAVANDKNIYGVTTSFGGLSHIKISKKDAQALQHNLFYFLKAGAGEPLPIADVRAGMVLRANSLMQGVSAIRPKVINRLIECLNLGITPVVCEYGSIGASGDLVPLASVGGAMIGLDEKFKVFYKNKEQSCLQVLKACHLPRIKLQAKEALAILNGTSMLTGIAANCLFDTKLLLHTALAANVFLLQALNVSVQPFDPFIHNAKPHKGQIWIAKQLLKLLDQSRLVRHEDQEKSEGGELRQDRYASRCLPQYLGPVIDGIETIAKQIVVEANSVTDNPLIDVERGLSLHGGNFLGEYPAVAMDQLRYYIGLIAKHLDVQIANVVSPAFSNGLPASLIGNTNRKVNCGFKGLQICSNSIVPVILFMGNPIANRYLTHSEEYNQNISSQGYESSILTSKTVDMFRQFIAIALMFSIQAVSLRTKEQYDHYDPRAYLSPYCAELYEVFFKLLGKRISDKRPYVFNDDEQALDHHVKIIVNDLRTYQLLPKFIFKALGN